MTNRFEEENSEVLQAIERDGTYSPETIGKLHVRSTEAASSLHLHYRLHTEASWPVFAYVTADHRPFAC